MKIAINGLGRIGRLVFRAIFENGHDDIEIVAVNGPADIKQHLHLLKYDSTHGIFLGDIIENQGKIQVKYGNRQCLINVLSERDPSQINWSDFGVDYVLECTGKFNERELAAKHLQSGCRKVIISAPCKNADVTIVKSVNDGDLQQNHEIISVGSCTTNALAPIAKILHDNIGIEKGFMTTIHAYTGDQNILDGSHKDLRRARAAAMSMVPTSTGAARALKLVIPELAGKIDGAAIRVPTANVSLIDLTFLAQRKVSADEINQIVNKNCQNHFKGIVEFSDQPLVSVDFNHNMHSSIFDSLETKVTDDNFCRIISWYDNEWGFACRMIDVLRLAS